MGKVNKQIKDWEDSIMFECECHGKHFLTVCHDIDEKYPDDSIWFHFIDYPSSLWNILKIWWRQRHVCTSELQLTPDDMKELIKVVNRYLLKVEHNKEVYLKKMKFKKDDKNNRRTNNTDKTK